MEEYNAASSNGAGAEVRFVSPFKPGSTTHDVLDGVCVLSMAGVAGEVLACGDAQGGYADVVQLRSLCSVASPPISSARDQDERIRWALLMALTMLQNNREALDALVVQLEAAQDVETCARAIEAA